MLSEAAVAVLSRLSYQPDAHWLVNVHPFGSVYWAVETPGTSQFVRCHGQDHAVIRRKFGIRRVLWSAEPLSDGDDARLNELTDLIDKERDHDKFTKLVGELNALLNEQKKPVKPLPRE